MLNFNVSQSDDLHVTVDGHALKENKHTWQRISFTARSGTLDLPALG